MSEVKRYKYMKRDAMTAAEFYRWLNTDPDELTTNQDDGALCADHDTPYPCSQCQYERETERAEAMYEEYGHWPKERR